MVSGRRTAEHDFNHRGRLHEHVQRVLGPIPRRAQTFENSAAGCRIGDRRRSCGEIEVSVTPEVDDKARVCVEVGQPIPLTRCPRDEETAVDIKHPYLNPARQPRLPSRGRNVHGRIVSEFDAHDIHNGSVRRLNLLHATYRRA